MSDDEKFDKLLQVMLEIKETVVGLHSSVDNQEQRVGNLVTGVGNLVTGVGNLETGQREMNEKLDRIIYKLELLVK